MQFWNQWRKDYRQLGYFIGILFISSLLFLWYSYFTGIESSIQWQKFPGQKTIETVAHTFQVGTFEFSIPIESYLTSEYFNGSTLAPNVTSFHIFILMFALASVVLLAVITTLERFWYFVGIGLFILLVVGLRLNVLQLFGISGQGVTITALVIYVLVSYYFTAFNSSADFKLRFSVFSGLTAILGLVIYFFSTVEYPFFHLAVTAYVPAIILTIVFIVMVAHEVLASFIYLTSQGTTSSKSLQHFGIISLIYMTNLIVAYMHEAGFIQWNFLYINLYLLLTISGILGIWGFRHRETLYRNITQFNPFGAYFMVSLGAIAFSTIGMLLGATNDAALKLIRDFIIFSHIAFGGVFLVYILSNFVNMLDDSLNVYKVLYNPNRMPYGAYRFAGFIGMLGFIFYSGWQDYAFHGTAGFYNNLGDLYQTIDKRGFAEAYYQQGRTYSFQNHHSNYVLGYLEGSRNNMEQAYRHYDLANDKRPTEFSLVNEANLYLFEARYFEAIEAFKKALKEFPDSGPIKNNLGYAYSKVHMVDSASLMLQQAGNQAISKETAEMNFLAVIGHEYIPVKADSLFELLSSASAGVIGNALAVATNQNQNFNADVKPLSNKQLDLHTATVLNNYIVNKLKSIDSAFLTQALRIASDSINADYSEAVKVSLAHAFYHDNQVGKALEILAELAYLSQSRQGKYNYIMGLWALEQDNPELAVQCFDYAVDFNYKEAQTYSAIALAETHQIPLALISLDTLFKSKNENEIEIARQLKEALTISFADVLKKTDDEKYQYFRFRLGVRDTVNFQKLTATLSNPNLKAKVILEMAERLFNSGNTASAIRLFGQLDGLQFTDALLNERIQYFELELLASRGQLRLLASKINDGIEFNRSRSLEKMLYTAMLNEASGDTLAAEKNYRVLAKANPFYEEGIIAAARYYKKHSTDPLKAYTIITDALHVNLNSIRLLNVYIAEAVRMGYDEYAADAVMQLEEAQKRQ
jgi:Flp pilus assembly protein TadD